MKTLETLLNELGLTEHMEELSDWRDALLVEKAEELQQVHNDHAEEITALNTTHGDNLSKAVSEKNAEIVTLQTQFAALEQSFHNEIYLVSQRDEEIVSLKRQLADANAANTAASKTIQDKNVEIQRLSVLASATEDERMILKLEEELAALKARTAQAV